MVEDTFRSQSEATMAKTIFAIFNNDIFIGNIVEYNNTECIEHVLAECHHRFNTYLRENVVYDKGGNFRVFSTNLFFFSYV